MNITDSKIKFMKDGNMYTLLKKDEDGAVKIHYNGNIENILTKQDLIDNMPGILYKDNIKIYMRKNDELIQLAVKEDIENITDAYIIEYNNSNDEIIYDPGVCIANDDSISLTSISVSEEIEKINTKSETKLSLNNTAQDKLFGIELAGIDLDDTNAVYNLSTNIDENYTVNKISQSQYKYSTLSYTEVEVI